MRFRQRLIKAKRWNCRWGRFVSFYRARLKSWKKILRFRISGSSSCKLRTHNCSRSSKKEIMPTSLSLSLSKKRPMKTYSRRIRLSKAYKTLRWSWSWCNERHKHRRIVWWVTSAICSASFPSYKTRVNWISRRPKRLVSSCVGSSKKLRVTCSSGRWWAGVIWRFSWRSSRCWCKRRFNRWSKKLSKLKSTVTRSCRLYKCKHKLSCRSWDRFTSKISNVFKLNSQRKSRLTSKNWTFFSKSMNTRSPMTSLKETRTSFCSNSKSTTPTSSTNRRFRDLNKTYRFASSSSNKKKTTNKLARALSNSTSLRSTHSNWAIPMTSSN